jgi:hypothetical protein
MPIPMLIMNMISRTDDKDPALLPEIAGGQALVETLTQGFSATHQGCWSQGFPKPANEAEGLEGYQLFIQVHLSCEVEVLHKMPGLRRCAATHGDQGDTRLVQPVFDAHHGSSLLPAKHSSEMAQKNKRDPSFLPKRIHRHRRCIEIQYAQSSELFKHCYIFHQFSLPGDLPHTLVFDFPRNNTSDQINHF